jgi:hypothetical protein
LNKIPLVAALAGILAFAALPCHADQLKVRASALSQADAAALQGKSLAITLHERQSFQAMTAGKAMFGLIGIGAMFKAGNDFVEQNQIPDPTIIAREQFANMLRDQFGMVPMAVDTTVTKPVKPAELVKVHPDSDYILSVMHIGSMYAYYPGKWDGYWVGNSLGVQLIHTASGKVVSRGNCTASTHKNPVRPSLEQLSADRAQLTKDILASLAWKCSRQLAIEGFKLTAERAPVIPAELENPLSRVTAAAPAANGTPAATAPETPAPESAEPETPESEAPVPETPVTEGKP